MEKRILIQESKKHVGSTVVLGGWIVTSRVHGKIAFFDLRDQSGVLQVGVFAPDLVDSVKSLSQQDVVSVKGTVKEREERYINPDLPFGTIELEASEIKVISKADTLPFDMGGRDLSLELPTLLDYRSLTLRHPKIKAIFDVQAGIARAFREAAEKLGCVEIFVPTITATPTEGGAEVFRVDYYDTKAYLAQSPQLYKQIMVGALERVYAFSHAYRAEPSVTTRHLAEVVQIDIELGFISDFSELLDALEFVASYMMEKTYERYPYEMKLYSVEKPLIPSKIPRLTLREAQEIISKRTGRDISNEGDLSPEDEREICTWAKEEKESEFVTITHFPTIKKPFYTHPDPENPAYSLSYDLLFRGIEILSGSQRINNYDDLITAMKKRGMSIKGFDMYLQAFKYGLPPEGGFSFGLERLTMKLLGLDNVREASLFPRDMERIDLRLSTLEKE